MDCEVSIRINQRFNSDDAIDRQLQLTELRHSKIDVLSYILNAVLKLLTAIQNFLCRLEPRWARITSKTKKG